MNIDDAAQPRELFPMSWISGWRDQTYLNEYVVIFDFERVLMLGVTYRPRILDTHPLDT